MKIQVESGRLPGRVQMKFQGESGKEPDSGETQGVSGPSSIVITFYRIGDNRNEQKIN